MQRAIPIMFIAMSLIPAGDSAGKILTSGMGVAPVFVAWSRFAIGALMVLPFLPRGTWGLMRDWRLWLRAGTLALGITCIQTALRTEAIANVFAAFFIGPMISYLLAAIFLRERVRMFRITAVAVGLVGVTPASKIAGRMLERDTEIEIVSGLDEGQIIFTSP